MSYIEGLSVNFDEYHRRFNADLYNEATFDTLGRTAPLSNCIIDLAVMMLLVDKEQRQAVVKFLERFVE